MRALVASGTVDALKPRSTRKALIAIFAIGALRAGTTVLAGIARSAWLAVLAVIAWKTDGADGAVLARRALIATIAFVTVHAVLARRSLLTGRTRRAWRAQRACVSVLAVDAGHTVGTCHATRSSESPKWPQMACDGLRWPRCGRSRPDRQKKRQRPPSSYKTA